MNLIMGNALGSIILNRGGMANYTNIASRATLPITSLTATDYTTFRAGIIHGRNGRKEMGAIKPLFSNFYLENGTGTEISDTGTIRVWCALLHDGVYYPFSFGASAFIDILAGDNGAFDAHADLVIPAYDEFDFLTLVHVASGSKMPASYYLSSARSEGHAAGSVEADMLKYLDGRTAFTQADGFNVLGPSQILGKATDGSQTECVAVLGDSIGDGNAEPNNGGDAYGNRGYLRRGFAEAGYYCMPLTKSGATIAGLEPAINPGRVDLVSTYATHMVIETGENSLGVSNVHEVWEAHVGRWKAVKDVPVVAAKPLVKANSSDLWATLANQSVAANDAYVAELTMPSRPRFSLRAYQDTLVSNGTLAGAIDGYPYVTSPTVPDKWNTVEETAQARLANDYVHPTVDGHVAMIPAVTQVIEAGLFNVSPPSRRVRPFDVPTPPTIETPIVIDLSDNALSASVPGWNATTGLPDVAFAGTYFPADRDLLILGSQNGIRTGLNRINGGRRVAWIGGAYTKRVTAANVALAIHMEGLAVLFPDGLGTLDVEDAFTAHLKLGARDNGLTSIHLINCVGHNVQGFIGGTHGDVFALSSTAEYPHHLYIDGLSGSTNTQGLYLAAFDWAGGRGIDGPMPVHSEIKRVNLRQTQEFAWDSVGVLSTTHNVDLLNINDTSETAGRPYPRKASDIYLEPAGSLRNCFAHFGVNAVTGANQEPVIESGVATYDPSYLFDGDIKFGRPPLGDFAPYPDENGLSQNGGPGIGYVSPGYARPALNYYTLSEPLVLEEFDSLTGVTVANSDTPAVVDGGIQVQAIGTVSHPQITKADIGVIDPATLDYVAYQFEVSDDALEQQINTIGPRLGQGGSYPSVDDGSLSPSLSNDQFVNTGTFWHGFESSDNPTLIALPTGTTGTRITSVGRTPYAGKFKINLMLARARGRSQILVAYDDIRTGPYEICRPLLNSLDIKATFYVPTALVGEADRLTEAQLGDLYRDGHDLAVNGTSDDTQMTSFADMATLVADVQASRAWLRERGWHRAIDHFCYPGGTDPDLSYQIPGTAINVAEATADGSDVVVMADTTGIVAGMTALGYGVPSGTTVVSVDSGTTVTLSENVPAQAKPMKFVDHSGAFAAGKIQAAMAAIGMKTGRTTIPSGFYARYGLGDRGLLLPGCGVTGESFAQSRIRIDNAVARGESLITYFHQVGEEGSINDGTEDHNLMLELIASYRDANLADAPAISGAYSVWRGAQYV